MDDRLSNTVGIRMRDEVNDPDLLRTTSSVISGIELSVLVRCSFTPQLHPGRQTVTLVFGITGSGVDGKRRKTNETSIGMGKGDGEESMSRTQTS